MKRTVLVLVGLLMIAGGVWVFLFPFVSVVRASGEVLDQLPAVSTASFSDERNEFALFDAEFVLATRTYDGATAELVRDELVAAGFERYPLDDGLWLRSACCGEYDAALVRVEDRGSGDARVILTVTDDDIQLSWPFLALFGLGLGGAGFGVVRRGRRPASSTDAMAGAATQDLELVH